MNRKIIRVLLRNISPVLLVKARVQGGGAFEHRHLTLGDLHIQRGVCVNERLHQLCGGSHFLLKQKNAVHSSRGLLMYILRDIYAAQSNAEHLLIDVVGRNINVNGVLVVHKSADARHGRVQQALLFV